MDISRPSSDPLQRIQPPVRPGDRLTVRRRLPDGSATDVIGFVDEADAQAVTMITVEDVWHRIERSMIIAARRVPPARGGRDPVAWDPEELQQIAAPGWVDQAEPLGDWLLRSADGFTRRANSALATGDPGLPIAEAARTVIDFYRSRGLPPLIQVVAGSTSDTELRALGWHDGGPDTVIMVTRLSALIDAFDARLDARADDPPDDRHDGRPVTKVEITDQPSADWWRALLTQRGLSPDRPPDPGEAAVRVVGGRPPVGFASIGQPPQSVGRGRLNRDWLGIAAMWTDPTHRRAGRAAQIIEALARWAARRGARNVYLQVEAANAPAIALYEQLGFVHHHDYSYLAPPG